MSEQALTIFHNGQHYVILSEVEKLEAENERLKQLCTAGGRADCIDLQAKYDELQAVTAALIEAEEAYEGQFNLRPFFDAVKAALEGV